MYTAWRDGKMPFEQYKEEHELDTRTLAEDKTKPAPGDVGGKPEGGAPKM